MADERSAADIERELAQARARLAANLTQLVTEVHPKAVIHRSVADVKHSASVTVENARTRIDQSCAELMSHFKDESGWKWKNIIIASAATALVVTVIIAKKKK